MKTVFPEKQVNYILRLYVPHWNYDNIMADIIRFCLETNTQHVMLVTDALHMVWNQLTLAEAKREAETIGRAIESLAPHGIKVGINSSYNMEISRFDHSKHNSQYRHWTTLADGTCEKRLPCLLDPALNEYLIQYYQILASTKAEYIYMDDAHRYIFSGRNNTWGCMCNLHLEAFSGISGVQWTRESLQKAIFQEKSVRKQWIKFLKNRLDEIAMIVEKTVHSVNPEMKIGLMLPSLHTTSAFDYDFLQMARLFQPEGKLLLRPCISPYCDRNRTQFMPGLFNMEMVHHIMGDSAEYTPEIEISPSTRFSKSMEVIRLHIAQGIVNRMFNPAISACGYVGNSPYFEPAIAKMLKREKPYFDALAKIAPEQNTKKGIGLRFHRSSACSTPNHYPSVMDYSLPVLTVHDFLAGSGFCLTYDKSSVTLLAGDSVYAFSDDELKDYLKGNLILDSVAAKAFADRGYLEYTGANTAAMDVPFGAQYFSNPDYCGKYTGTYGPLKDTPLSDVQKIVNVQPGAEIISEVTDHDRKTVCPGMTLFKNKWGGKIAVMHLRIGPALDDVRQFVSYQMQTLMRNLLRKMDTSVLPVIVENPSCFAVQYFDNGINAFVGFSNLSCDTAEEIIVSFENVNLEVGQGVYLHENGTLQPLSDIMENIDENRWKIKKQLTIFHYFAIQIPIKGGKQL